jgi:hypothetical protein
MVTVTESRFTHPIAFVPVTYYFVVTEGVATGFAQFVQLKDGLASQT